jgi:hypothetical protein
MKKRITGIAIGILLSFTTTILIGQHQPQMSSSENERMDSLAAEYKTDRARNQQQKDKHRMDAAKDARKDSKADAKEARRIENDANDAAYDSKIALRMERKAQKARRKADKQSTKASDSRKKSALN